jgi:uncharacterized protein with PIN domain
MKISQLDDEFFWESMQDHGWMERGNLLISKEDQRISVDRDRQMYYRDVYIEIQYTDANYAELLRFDKDQEVQKKWCSLKYELLRFTRSEAVHLATVRLNGYAIEYIKDPSEEVQLAAVRRNRDAIYYIKNPCPIALQVVNG